jgi:hypothetical protein
MTTPTVPLLVTEPGLYDGMPEEQYHSDPVPAGSLSSTGARELLGCPAKYAHSQEHGRPDSKAFDLGKVAHALILGTGAQYAALPYDDWKTKKAQQERDAARAAGLVPLTRGELAQAEAILAAFRTSPAAALLAEDGLPERTLVWVDEETGVWCRARLDWSNELTTVDLKTTKDADPYQFGRWAATYGYHIQEAFYLRGIRTLGLADNPEFVFALVEKTPPYLTSAVVLDAEAVAVGDELVSRALRRYAECDRTGYWPGYPTGIVTVSLPRWATYSSQEDWA